MKQVSAYQTDDGQLFVDGAQARTHEMDNAVLTIGGVTVDQLRNALHGQDGTKAIRDALKELGDEVKRQNAVGEQAGSSGTGTNTGAADGVSNVPQASPVPPELQDRGETKSGDHVFTDNGHIGFQKPPDKPDTGGS